MVPFTSGQQAFIERINLQNVDDGVRRIVLAAIRARNEMSAGADFDLCRVIDDIAG